MESKETCSACAKRAEEIKALREGLTWITHSMPVGNEAWANPGIEDARFYFKCAQDALAKADEIKRGSEKCHC